MHADATRRKELRHRTIARTSVRRVIAREKECDLVCSGAARGEVLHECGERARPGPLYLQECGTARLKFAREFAQAFAQEPGAICARATTREDSWLPDEDRQECAVCFVRVGCRRNQRRVIGEAEIATQPEDRDGSTHRAAIIPRSARTWRLKILG